MANYGISYDLVQDARFIQRVTSALAKAAVSIYNEDAQTVGHAQRVILAKAVLESPEAFAKKFAYALTVQSSIADAVEIRDIDIDDAIGAVWNVFAEVS